MTMVLRRLLTICLAATFLVGATVQLLPPSTALADTGMHNGKMAGCAGPEMPPVKHMPNCVDNLGCLVVQAVPSSPDSLAVPFRWTAVSGRLFSRDPSAPRSCRGARTLATHPRRLTPEARFAPS